MRILVASLMSLGFFTAPLAATSQAWLSDRETREGPGFKMGDSLLLHPGAVIEGGYDNNPLRDEQHGGAAKLRLSGYLDMATRARSRETSDLEEADPLPAKTDFRLGLATYYDFYFSGDSTVDNQDSLGVDTHLNLTLFPEGAFTVTLRGLYCRTTTPYESPNERHAHHVIDPSVSVRLRPGGGTLSLSLTGGANIILFEDGGVAARNNRVTANAVFETAWKMLPKTALISVVRFSPINYPGVTGINVNSKPVRGLLGIKSLLTPRFGLSVFGGYGASFYERGQNFEGGIVNGELMFFVTPTIELSLGGQRDFEDSFYANYYVKSGGYLKYDQIIAGLFRITLKGDAYYREYAYLSGQYGVTTPSTAYRNESRLGVTLILEWRAMDWLSVLASCIYQGNISNFAYESFEGDPLWTDYQKVEVMGGIQARY